MCLSGSGVGCGACFWGLFGACFGGFSSRRERARGIRRPECWGRPGWRRAGGRGSTIAVRSLRSGLPRRHLRCGLRPLPSDSLGRIDSPRPPARRHPRLRRMKFGRQRGRAVCLACFWGAGFGLEDLAGPPVACRPGGGRWAFGGVGYYGTNDRPTRNCDSLRWL